MKPDKKRHMLNKTHIEWKTNSKTDPKLWAVLCFSFFFYSVQTFPVMLMTIDKMMRIRDRFTEENDI